MLDIKKYFFRGIGEAFEMNKSKKIGFTFIVFAYISNHLNNIT